MPRFKSTEVVQLSSCAFTVWWVILLGVHVVVAFYNVVYGYYYWNLTNAYLNVLLVSFEIGLPPENDRAIAIIHIIMAVLHGVCILLMLGGSIWQRSLAFTPWASCNAEVKTEEVKPDRTSSTIARSFSKMYDTLSDRDGLLGVNGKHFHAIQTCREIVETALQTRQAYRMSVLLPRTLLNRFYIILIAVNCWAPAVVNTWFFQRDEARKRYAVIVLDCALGLMACVGVVVIVVLGYTGDFDLKLGGFDYLTWYNDEWMARAYNEFQVVIVVSWMDLASRTFFSLAEVDEKWSEFDSFTVVQMLIRHCPALEVPARFSDFHSLRGIKVYNSTIVDWGESAALTSTNHPTLLSLFLIRVNMTDGVLSAGFLSADFPPTVYDVEFCVTNLRELPDDLDTKWAQNLLLQFEYSQLTVVDPVLIRLGPGYLALTGNPITELPPDIFEIDNTYLIGISDMDIHELPRNVTKLSATLAWVFMRETNVSFFWDWADELVERMNPSSPWIAGYSPYCEDLAKIENGTATAFSVTLSPEYSQTLMDPSAKNIEVIGTAVNCKATTRLPSGGGVFHPLFYEDSINAIIIVLDCALNLMACVGVEAIVVLSYSDKFDLKLQPHNYLVWYDNEAVAIAVNEFQTLVVVSWVDLVSRTIFSLGLLATTITMKELLQRLPRNTARVSQPVLFAEDTPRKGAWGVKLDGVLPAGLLSTDFPPNVHDIDFCVTNLRELHDDLDTKCPTGTYTRIQLEYGQLTVVHPVLLRLRPGYLALTGNPITELSPGLFEIDSIMLLGISYMDIHELPQNVTKLSAALKCAIPKFRSFGTGPTNS
ncbi:hypothetical protein PF003_g10398 [Phytophthora fragariae]|nr:hypothetical protein PF003_g10398 [Phytophthora fragariae]